jgi:hypothetical protein
MDILVMTLAWAKEEDLEMAWSQEGPSQNTSGTMGKVSPKGVFFRSCPVLAAEGAINEAHRKIRITQPLTIIRHG